MDFNSLVYLGFFCAVAVVNYLLPKAARPWLLLAASYAFYLYDPHNAQLVALLLSATLITWACGLALGRLTDPWVRRLFLCLSFLTCMGVLFFYKYYDFFGQALLGIHFTPLKLVAPLGLSYFTFASLGYAVDQYQGKYPPEKNLFRYALFVSFFPAIVTGPIEQGDHLLPQLKAPRPFDYDRCAGGLFRMLWGYVKTMVIAEAVSPFVRQVYSHPADYAGPYLAVAAVLFSLYLYMNFSGCCDLAIGSTRILGYDLLENFESPFLAPTFRELWRRWHMSLTGWFRRYLYIPLGGSRKGLFRHCLNLLLVFLFSGLWHGADWGYLWWGLISGLLSVAGLLWDKALKRPKTPQPVPLPLRILQVIRTDLLFSLVFVFFAGHDIHRAVQGLVRRTAGACFRFCGRRAGHRQRPRCAHRGRLCVCVRGAGQREPVGAQAALLGALAAVLPAVPEHSVLRGVRPVRLHLPAILKEGVQHGN